ncbi:MAG TPA: glutamine--fructose-6-phosphate aminotransferase, partial [Elusimicrobiales bacterium]|nr:glutamine--fructose-6-phosphate aminotransferase [Elusimicrobiales bacterium]
MCGIVGYVGSRNSSDVLVEGLRRLEYRGYDSCGIASVKAKGGLYLKRVSGRIEALKGLVDADPPRDPGAGIGHTRWATHGVPSEDNAHPHTDCAGEMVLVHNGIIENYLELREKLAGAGHAFKSETDTEAAVHLLERNM